MFCRRQSIRADTGIGLPLEWACTWHPCGTTRSSHTPPTLHKSHIIIKLFYHKLHILGRVLHYLSSKINSKINDNGNHMHDRYRASISGDGNVALGTLMMIQNLNLRMHAFRVMFIVYPSGQSQNPPEGSEGFVLHVPLPHKLPASSNQHTLSQSRQTEMILKSCRVRVKLTSFN